MRWRTHSKEEFKRKASRVLAGLLAAAVGISSFGPQAASAAGIVASKARTGAVSNPSLTIPALSNPLVSAGTPISLAPSLGAGVLPVLSAPSLQAAPQAAAAPLAAAQQAPKRAPAAAAAENTTAPQPAKTVRAQIAQTVRQIKKTAAPRAGILNALYSGGLNAADDSAAAVAGGEPGRPSPSALRKPALAELIAAATDPAGALESRKSAVQAVAKENGDGARAALETIAAARPEGDAADYEVHREALRALDAAFGVHKSLRPISKSHKQSILAELAADKPELVLTDYDRTLAGTKVDISPAMAEAVASVPKAGVEIAILTDRPAEPRFEGDITIFQSLAPMTAAQKRKLTVLSDVGAKTSVFARNGAPVLVDEIKSAWSQEQLKTLAKASKALQERFADQEFLGNTEVYEVDEYERFLPRSLSDEEIAEAGRITDAIFKEAGMSGVHIVSRRPLGAGDVPYLRVSMTDKSAAAGRVRKNIRLLERARDVVGLGGGARALRAVKKLFSRVPARPVAARNTLLIGDSFMPETVTPGADTLMAGGAPGAMTLAVAGLASPRIDNIFVWPTRGEAASLEILGAVGAPIAGDVDKKAVAGMFAQRTVSIASYILTTIAFTAIAVPAVGWVGFGAIMAIGSLAPIAVGPLNGWIVDKLSARNSMAMNTAARVVLDFLPPLLVLLGMVNMPMLVIAAIANFWILSSVMTTEGAYIKRLAGQKLIGPINSMLWMNYLIVQVLLALILGFGGVVGFVGPVNAYLLAAAINAFIALPIVWFTMPNTKPAAKDLPAARPNIGAAALFKQYRLGATLLGATVLSYFLLWASPIPIALALGFLVMRTDSAKRLWAGHGREIGSRETELSETVRAINASADKDRQGELRSAKAEITKWKKTPRLALIFLTINALTLGPLQSFAIPRFTEAATGLPMQSPESTLLFGQYLGALFLGSLIANAAQVRLPELRVPFIGRVPGQRFVQLVVALLAPLWTYTSLFPGSLPIAAAAFAVAAGLMMLAARLTNRAWLQFAGIGMAGIWLPYLFWGSSVFPVTTAMFLAVVAAGMVFGPSFVALKTIFEGGFQKAVLGRMIGVQGSLLNAARSIAIGGTAAIYGALNPAFPAFLAILGGFYAAIGIAMFLAPRFFPSLPKTLLHPKQ